jgi:hypothetical protein
MVPSPPGTCTLSEFFLRLPVTTPLYESAVLPLSSSKDDATGAPQRARNVNDVCFFISRKNYELSSFTFRARNAQAIE